MSLHAHTLDEIGLAFLMYRLAVQSFQILGLALALGLVYPVWGTLVVSLRSASRKLA